jgi:hypothetical protein
MDDQAKFASPENTMSEILKSKPRDFRIKEKARRRIIRTYPMPDFSNIKPKVKTSMRKPKIEAEEEKVSGAVTHSAVQKQAGVSPVIGLNF